MRHEVATVLLGPILMRQGKKAHRHITQLPEPPGERQGISGSGAPLKILIIGDSAGAGVGASSQDAALSGQIVQRLAPLFTVQWHLQARSGATTVAALRHLKRLDAEPWDWIVVSLGANDVVARHTLKQWRANLDTLRDALDERFDKPQLLFSGLPPMHLFPAMPQPLRWYIGERAKEFDQVLADWAPTRKRTTRLSTDFPRDPKLLATDGFHPGPGLYELWGQAVADHIADHIGGHSGP